MTWSIYKNIICAYLLLVTFSVHSQVTNNLKMVWNDEFDGNTLDATKWSTCPEWSRQGGSYWSDENYELTGKGQVKLWVDERNDSVFCGAIRTHNKFDKKYGYFEVRCKVPQLRGGWAAFWMMPYGNKPGSQGNDGTEIDIFESINGWQGKINHALHWDGYGVEHQKNSYRFDRPDLYDNNYHKFGFMWTPDEYVFYIDDAETWRTSSGGVTDVNQYMKLTMEVASGWWAGNWTDQDTKPIEWLVDYVRVYDYQPIVIQDSLSLNFAVLNSGTNFNVGDDVSMNVNLSGDLTDANELIFLVKRDDGAFEVQNYINTNGPTSYAYTYSPVKTGTYTFRVTANLNGNYVTHTVVGDVIVQAAPEPLTVKFSSLQSGSNYLVGSSVNMNVELSAALSDADELKFMVKKDSGVFETIHSFAVNSQTNYPYVWTPIERGTYSLRVTALKNDNYVTHITANITVLENLPTRSMSSNNMKDENHHIFPNPVADELVIVGAETNVSYLIVDPSGGVVLSGNGNKINVDRLSSGVYYLLIKEKIIAFVKL